MNQKAQIINLPKILDKRGNLSFIQNNHHIPFQIQRAFWIYDVPGGEVRGNHAYKTQQEFIVALSGSFDVVIKTNEGTIKFHLNRPYYGLYIPPLTWRHMENFSTNSLSLHLSDSLFDSNDYIRNIEEYEQIIRQ